MVSEPAVRPMSAWYLLYLCVPGVCIISLAMTVLSYFRGTPTPMSVLEKQAAYEAAKHKQNVRASLGRSVMMMVGFLLCFVAVVLPSDCEHTIFPWFLTLAVHQKLVASYILGLLTMAVVAYH